MSEISKMFEQPELVKSTQSAKVYTVIAHKGESKLAINCIITTDYKSGKKQATIGLTLRIIEVIPPTGQEWPSFNAFGFRSRDKYPSKDGPDTYIFRGDLYYMPVTSAPCSPGDFLKSLEAQQVITQVSAWLETHIKNSGGMMVIGTPALHAALGASLEAVPDELPMLFQLPSLNPKHNGFTEDEKPKSMGKQPPHPSAEDLEGEDSDDYEEGDEPAG